MKKKFSVVIQRINPKTLKPKKSKTVPQQQIKPQPKNDPTTAISDHYTDESFRSRTIESELQKTNKKNNQKNGSAHFHEGKLSSETYIIQKDDRKQVNERDKKKLKHFFYTVFILMWIALISIVISYIVVVSLPKSSKAQTTITTTAASFLWNNTGITVAGVSTVSGISFSNLNQPSGIILDSSNALYIADTMNHRVMKYSFGASSGAPVVNQTTFGGCILSGYLYAPEDLVLNTNSDIYVSDTGCYMIRLMSVGATSTTIVAGGGYGSALTQIAAPRGIVIDPRNLTIYVADSDNHRIMQWVPGAPNGTIIAGGNGAGTASNQLSSPRGMYYDSSTDSLVIANRGANNIVRWVLGASSWTIVVGSVAGTSGSSTTTLNGPTDVTFDSSGNIYVVDSGNNRVQFFRSGQTNGTTIAGTGSSGSGLTELNSPNSVALDSSLNLYVSDTQNHRVQKFMRS